MPCRSHRLIVLTLLLAALSLPCWAETLSAPQFRLKIDPKAKITHRADNGWEKSMTVELHGEQARVRFRPDGVLVIFANGTLRSQLNPHASETSYELVTDFEGKRYKVTRSAREISWLLPGHEVFFRTFGGKVASAVGSSDFLNITRDSQAGRLSVESQAGTSDILLRKGALEVFEGPELLEHTYFVKGLAFHRGALTLEIPLPEEPFLKALPANRFLLVESLQAPPVEPGGEPIPDFVPEPETSRSGPLDAEPSSWDSPVYRSQKVDRKDDPFNARREVRASSKERPLDAKTAPNSEELLQVKDVNDEGL